MAERLKHQQEQERSYEQDTPSPEVSKPLDETKAERQEVKQIEQLDAEKLSTEVEKHAKPSEEINRVESTPTANNHEFAAYGEQKSQTYSRTLKRVQQRLSKPERLMSQAMHNKNVEKLSEGIGKTAARPSGILGGGIVSLLGSFILLYVSKKYGFEYNFFVFFMLLALGFMTGVLLEILIAAIRKAKT